MIYAIITIILFVCELVYFKIADKYNIIDKPNTRSSHNYITIRGGGIVFWLAALLYFIIALTVSSVPIPTVPIVSFFSGLTMLSIVSFWDDIKSLPNKIRIIIHFLSISLVFYGLNLYSTLPWYLILIAYIFFVGILNAYNFMDGINGITGLYSLAILISLQYINRKYLFTEPDFINFAIIACIVFLFFNFRKKAKCFAGDIGSMAISFWIVTSLLQLMLKTNSIIWIMFLAVYGVDTVFTILHRLCLKQNIFKPHRLHFYQILANEKHLSHQLVSFLYAAIQLLIGGVIIAVHFKFPQFESVAAIAISLILVLVYLVKFKFLS
ncbi:MAG: glycosyltransferase family 4 protein [Candidatus Symbiothrix sp.]|jgi:UDP-N-acetylmuramyl pentapeptide phosphotransferase/UDP-N-acetylglucosamine-1-phosphate transferase|nr:glycosyltransferase family 4 protein [Candidatus Symbiothrix sp.]